MLHSNHGTGTQFIEGHGGIGVDTTSIEGWGGHKSQGHGINGG